MSKSPYLPGSRPPSRACRVRPAWWIRPAMRRNFRLSLKHRPEHRDRIVSDLRPPGPTIHDIEGHSARRSNIDLLALPAARSLMISGRG